MYSTRLIYDIVLHNRLLNTMTAPNVVTIDRICFQYVHKYVQLIMCMFFFYKTQIMALSRKETSSERCKWL